MNKETHRPSDSKVTKKKKLPTDDSGHLIISSMAATDKTRSKTSKCKCKRLYALVSRFTEWWGRNVDCWIVYSLVIVVIE